ncbi:MAG TPA: endonuclease/exonuclease/phosphatase family protein, partial [Planctomycetaceae bacterium]|nr:endonuclease/exonuclease/phosphatase family protein [Planctomycetaceae bacterium]
MVTFLPRLPGLLPGVLLLFASLLVWSRAFWVNLAVVLFTLVSIMGFNVPWQSTWEHLTKSEPAAVADLPTIRLVSANVQAFGPDFGLLLREVLHAKPDVIAFQEAARPPKLLDEQFPDWHVVRKRGLWVGSKWPVKLLGQCDSDVYQRVTAIAVEVDAPFGKFVLTDLHLMTARRSLIHLKPKALVNGEGPRHVTAALRERDEEARQTRAFLADFSHDTPSIVCGDFNMPTSSSIYRTYFGDFTNAFEAAAWGFGYTAPCKAPGFWPTNTPWQRVDHILASGHWQVVASHIGLRDGSDHRLIAATLRLRGRDNLPPVERGGPVDLSDAVERLR